MSGNKKSQASQIAEELNHLKSSGGVGGPPLKPVRVSTPRISGDDANSKCISFSIGYSISVLSNCLIH